jgi:hypothetical protein
MHDIYIGIDNGVTGTIGIIGTKWSDFIKTPTKTQQSYTKTKQNITRVNFPILKGLLEVYKATNIIAVLERPMVNPGRFKASVSAIRALETTLIILEELGYAYMYCDSKEWQKEMLPSGLKGPELKTASVDIGCRLFPNHEHFIRKHKDADGLLIAEWARRNNL